MNIDEIQSWLRQNDPIALESLWKQADQVRAAQVGQEVHLRGLIEISNVCRRQCLYCGIRAGNTDVQRYRLTVEEVLHCVELAEKFGYGSIVIQAGEDTQLSAQWVADLLSRIRERSNLAITLSLGERPPEDWILWKAAGANRYLLRFETSNERLFNAIHPPYSGLLGNRSRIEMLMQLREIGYEIGSGIMVGIPGQSYNDLAKDINLFRELNLDMIGLGPFLPHPSTPLGEVFQSDPQTGVFLPQEEWTDKQLEFFRTNGIDPINLKDQVSSSDVLAFKVVALTRLVCPNANIPSTTALATIDGKNGRKLGLMRGANIVMPNLTPIEYRKKYEIYPNKAAIFLTPEETDKIVLDDIRALGRIPGTGPGNSKVGTTQ